MLALLCVATLALVACGPCEHEYGSWDVTQNATCTSTGEKQRTCIKCGDVQTETVALAEHTESAAVKENEVAATCGQDGTYDSVVYCSVCHAEVSRTPQTTPKTNEHAFGEWHDVVNATCTDDGTKGYKNCSLCNKHYDASGNEIDDIVITALGHDIQNRPAQEATCLQVGWDAYETCSRCDYTTYVEKPISYDHNFEGGVCVDCGIELATGLSYTESSDGTYYIVSGLGEETRTEFAIPSTHNGKPVLEIGGRAFSDCDSIQKVAIPSGVTAISGEAFRYCYSLRDVTIPSSVTEIHSFAFNNCGLVSVTIPSSITYLDYDAFSYCHNLTKVVLEEGLSAVLKGFKGCENLTDVKIPSSITTIGGFGGTGLTSITIPDSVTTILGYAFQGCEGLTSITIPDSVTTIWDYAFEWCTGLTSIIIPSRESISDLHPTISY